MRKGRAATKSLICAAIRSRSRLQFRYEGLDRVVEPYCHGISTRDVEVVRAIQIRGSSNSRGFGFGKLWAVAKMMDLRVTEETFVPDDPHYNPNDSGMKIIHCRV
jgi:hypothetical protein